MCSLKVTFIFYGASSLVPAFSHAETSAGLGSATLFPLLQITSFLAKVLCFFLAFDEFFNVSMAFHMAIIVLYASTSTLLATTNGLSAALA